ncbi:MAG: hypothetical protein JWP61_2629, partial [Friedmanniella sp.]|nr:hypothetical protein [Friedmanniella sp.]
RAAGGRWLDPADLGLAEGPTEGGREAAAAYAVVLDGILGIGGRAGLTGVPARVVAAVAAHDLPVIACDLPSGVAADTGAAPGTVVAARRTVTFGVLKPCHLLEPARSLCGEVELVDIGLDPTAAEPVLAGLDEAGLAASWPYPAASADKYARGVVGIDTGSEQYPGAAVMSTYGAVYAGAGMVRFLGAERPAQVIGAQLPNVVFSPGRVQAHLFGSGWGERPDGAQVLARAAEDGVPAVVDADGLTFLPPRCPPHWLLTPHAGELARLLGRERAWVEEDPVRAARAGSARTGATVLLKGAAQVVAAPGTSLVRVALPGPSWTAQAGSGDVLGGLCAALLAAGCSPAEAGQLGASVQAYAATRSPGVLPPVELARTVGALLGDLQAQTRRGRR